MTASTTRTTWPTSALAAADIAFQTLTTGPEPLSLDCALLDRRTGLPATFMPLPRLRTWLLAHRTAYAARDAVWRDLVGRARNDGPEWMIATVGMAMPALVRFAGTLSRGYRGDTDDLDAEILTGFLTAIRTIDVGRDRLYARLCWAGFRAGIAARNADNLYLLVGDVEQLSGAAPHLPYGHPDLIVARAVSTGVIDRDEADLILATRLDGVPIEQLAAAAGLSAAVVRMRRLRAERALADAIRSGLLAGVIGGAARGRLDRRQAVRTAARSASPAA
jgi:hypothetical protein